jgi:hypothetical protein
MPKKLKMPQIYICEKCNFECCKKSNYVQHLLTSKHQNRTKLNSLEQKKCQPFICTNCNKTYSVRNSLWYHSKKCTFKIEEPNLKPEPTDKELIMLLIKENAEMKNLVLDVCQKIQPININNTNNSHNKTFNLNVFLNEECKDAMNIMDFVDSLKLQLTDLENVGKTGFVNGISNIIVKNLKALDIHKRPMHCSDLKREILYVKDEDKWNKENEDYQKMKQVIHKITHKNIKQIPEWVNENPLCKDSSSIKNDEYMNLLSNCMSGDCNEEQLTNMNKIISKVAKEVIIEKDK